MTKTIIFFAVFLLTFFVRLDAIKGGNLPFTTDQGRDMIDIRSIAVGHKLRLIGPTTSINGVYLGPFWYYFNLPPFVVSGGDPSAILIWQIIWYQFAGLLVYFLFKKANPYLAFFVSVLFLIMPTGFNTSRYSWNANAMPIFSALFLVSLYFLKQKTTSIVAFFVGIVAGLSFQVEAAFGILFFPFSWGYLLTRTRKIKIHFWHLAGFLLTLAPQGLFELRHQFSLTKVFLAEISGQSTMLGEKLTLQERIADRSSVFLKLLQDISHLPVAYFYPIFAVVCFMTLVLLIKGYLTRSTGDFFLINVSFILIAFIFYLVFPQALKDWYLLGLSVPLVFLYACALTALFSYQDTLLRTAVVIILSASFVFTFLAQKEFLSVASKMASANKSSLKNSITDVDWVYQHADGQGFKVYSYLPSIYDYPYQYLFWWRGAKKYGYRPNDLAYLPNQPEYIDNMKSYFTNTRPMSAAEPTFLIIEREEQNPSFQTAWLGNFAKLCPIENTELPYGVEIRKLVKCPTK